MSSTPCPLARRGRSSGPSGSNGPSSIGPSTSSPCKRVDAPLAVRTTEEGVGETPSTIELYELMDNGELTYVKLGRSRRISRRALVDLAASGVKDDGGGRDDGRWRHFGCTSSLLDSANENAPDPGNLGGILGATRKCSDEFPGSRMCEIEEIRQSTQLPDVIPPLAWMTPLGGGCAGDQIINGVEVTIQWTCDDLQAPCRFPGAVGPNFEATGSVASVGSLCSTELPIACCGLLP